MTGKPLMFPSLVTHCLFTECGPATQRSIAQEARELARSEASAAQWQQALAETNPFVSPYSQGYQMLPLIDLEQAEERVLINQAPPLCYDGKTGCLRCGYELIGALEERGGFCQDCADALGVGGKEEADD